MGGLAWAVAAAGLEYGYMLKNVESIRRADLRSETLGTIAPPEFVGGAR